MNWSSTQSRIEGEATVKSLYMHRSHGVKHSNYSILDLARLKKRSSRVLRRGKRNILHKGMLNIFNVCPNENTQTLAIILLLSRILKHKKDSLTNISFSYIYV